MTTQRGYAINSQYLSGSQILGVTTLDDFMEGLELSLETPLISPKISTTEELTVGPQETKDPPRNEDMKKRELGKLKKIYVDYLDIIKTSTNGRDIRFAVKLVESWRPLIERLEREVTGWSGT